MVEKAGLKKFEVQQFAIGMKEIIEIPENIIEERFNLASGEGAAHLFVGQCTGHIPGVGSSTPTRRAFLSGSLCISTSSLKRN